MQFDGSDTPGCRRQDPSIHHPGIKRGNSSDTPVRRRLLDAFSCGPEPERRSSPDNPEGPSLDYPMSIPGPERDESMDFSAAPPQDSSTDIPESEQSSELDMPAGLRPDPPLRTPDQEQGNGLYVPTRPLIHPSWLKAVKKRGSSPDIPNRPSLDYPMSIPGPERDESMDVSAPPPQDSLTDIPESEQGNDSDISAGSRPDPPLRTPDKEQGNGLDVPTRPLIHPSWLKADNKRGSSHQKQGNGLGVPTRPLIHPSWLKADNSSDTSSEHLPSPFVSYSPSECVESSYFPAWRPPHILLYPSLSEQSNSPSVPTGSCSTSEKGKGFDPPAKPRRDSIISLPWLDDGNSSGTREKRRRDLEGNRSGGREKRRRDPSIYGPESERGKSPGVLAGSHPDSLTGNPKSKLRSSSEKGNGLDIPARPRRAHSMPPSGPDEGNSSGTCEKRRRDYSVYSTESERSKRSEVIPRSQPIDIPGSKHRKSSEEDNGSDIFAKPWRDPVISLPGLDEINSSGTPGKRRRDNLYHAGSERGKSSSIPRSWLDLLMCEPGTEQNTSARSRVDRSPHMPRRHVRTSSIGPVRFDPGSKLGKSVDPSARSEPCPTWPPIEPELDRTPRRRLDPIIYIPGEQGMPDDGDGLVPDQRTSGEADSVNPGNEASNCWGNFSFAMLAGDQDENSAEQVGEDCEDEDDTASRRQEVHEEPNPVVKLERYAYSDIVFNRQLVARNIVETLRSVADSQEAVDAVLTALSSLSLDCEPSVRTELVEQLPNIASFCASEGGLLENVIREHVVPILVQYLTDVANQVRKRTQVSLLFILERSLIDRRQLEEQICTLVVHLTESENVDDYRMEAVALMTKMAPYVGKETTAALFLPRFICLCQDASFHIRKVCAANFGDICSIVGQEYTEDNLPVFQMLCEDCVWGVRKACAEVFMPVSCVCSLEIRRTSLAPLFHCLLDDQSRWVRIAAFQALGPFISTFADPLRTGLYCSEDGVVSMRALEGQSDAQEESESPAETLVLKGTGTLESKAAADASRAESPVAPDTVDCGEVGTVEDSTSEKQEQQEAFDDKKPCRACSGMATGENACLHERGAVMGTMPEKLEEVATGCTLEMASDKAPAAPEQCESSLDKENMEGEQEGCTETVGPKEALSVEGDRGHLMVHVGADIFNTFQFWRPPIPEVEVDIEFLGNRPTAVHVRATSQGQDNRCFSSDLSVEILGANGKQITGDINQDNGISPRLSGDSTLKIRTASLSSLTSADQECNILSSSVTEASVDFNEAGEVAGVHKVRMSNSKEVVGTENALLAKSLDNSSDSWSAHDQDIIPVLLLERYQTMTDPALAQNLDSEIGRHCAHSLPAVALTLGRQYWPCLRKTYRCLVSDVQWKVRHIVASCLHELATILGPEIASEDLVPSFEGFVRDVDEVRVGLLERLALFLRGLSKADQQRLLPLLADFLCMDNPRNWRFRHTLARQLKEIATLYGPLDVHQYLVPIVSELLVDKVAEVRHMAVKAMVAVLQRLGPHYQQCKEVLLQLCEKVEDCKWAQRQLFCELVEQMVIGDCLSEEDLIGTVLPKLLYLRHDTVPNVRMALARCLVNAIWPKAFFWDSGNLYRDELKATLASLQEDADRDVRFCAQLYPKDSED